MYPFVASKEDELGFNEGDVIHVLEKADGGWWNGECNGKVGWFPEAYVSRD